MVITNSRAKKAMILNDKLRLVATSIGASYKRKGSRLERGFLAEFLG
jgi:hypothetical protein